MKVYLLILAHMPPAALNPFLQHIRDFDVAHPGCHFAVSADAEGMSTDELQAAIKVEPPLPFMTVIRKPE